MYCSSCGVATPPGLSYCKSCGAKLGGAIEQTGSEPPAVKPEMLVAAMVGVFVFGLVAITMLLGMMKAVLGLDAGQILAFALVCFLIMLALEGVFVRLLFRGKRHTPDSANPVQLKEHSTKELDAAQTRVLPEPGPSVTEHTTRAFDPIYNERSSK